MEKIDLKKQFKTLYNAPAKEPVIVDVPPLNFLMADGAGDPNSAQSYRDAVEALYAVSYTLKFMLKKRELAIDYAVMPLEGLWWTPDMTKFSVNDKNAWLWTAMIMQPDFITQKLVEKACEEVFRKKNPAALSQLRWEKFEEGPSAQIMHIGPYSAEAPTIQKLHEFIKSSGRQLRGKHHEIYLGDPRKSAPEKLKTIIRQPMEA